MFYVKTNVPKSIDAQFFGWEPNNQNWAGSLKFQMKANHITPQLDLYRLKLKAVCLQQVDNEANNNAIVHNWKKWH